MNSLHRIYGIGAGYKSGADFIQSAPHRLYIAL